jgi:hypothetical protein
MQCCVYAKIRAVRGAKKHVVPLQVCVQLGDVVPFRLHWPRGVDLRANNMQYRPYGRNPSHKLGNNARDDAANIGMEHMLKVRLLMGIHWRKCCTK